jgi:hypothetical protein
MAVYTGYWRVKESGNTKAKAFHDFAFCVPASIELLQRRDYLLRMHYHVLGMRDLDVHT